ncbi:DivIVA domain-containing protein [Leucobacter viscericola]|uniref:DivIVA domain-containing protein n=1 Tax=Leucobacter viscericola TaxID=2714935 RepID=A0A6G7XC59_9MICO|nr:DivIVA domain-containing protein [Leucobacter viscericola]QIK62143.1 DivIVA domain-containing protein [Leucobacter viscericola]
MSNPTQERTDLANKVINSRFATTKFKAGYDLNDVDDFLDTVARQLRDEPRAEVIAKTIKNAAFRQTKWRDGYNSEQVDRFLDELVKTLRTWQDPDLNLLA